MKQKNTKGQDQKKQLDNEWNLIDEMQMDNNTSYGATAASCQLIQ